jgi:hypothetical protein
MHTSCWKNRMLDFMLAELGTSICRTSVLHSFPNQKTVTGSPDRGRHACLSLPALGEAERSLSKLTLKYGPCPSGIEAISIIIVGTEPLESAGSDWVC